MAMTELHRAARSNLPQRARCLMSQGSDVNARDRLGRTPLHYVSLNNDNDDYYEIAEAMLRNGADPTAKDFQGNSPIDYLIKDGGVRIVSLFLNCCKLRVCIPNGSFDVPPDDNPEYLRVHEYEACFLLGVAAYHNNLEVLQMLLQKLPTVVVDHRNKSGQTPLHIAMKQNIDGSHEKVIKLLLKNGADMNARDNEGLTPIKYLFKSDHLKCLGVFFNFTWGAANVVPKFTGKEIKKADFELLLAHSHFGEIFHNEQSFEGLQRLPMGFGLWCLEHFAKFNIDDDDILGGIIRKITNMRYEYTNYYENCCHEIQLTLVADIIEETGINFYSLLMNNTEQMPDNVLVTAILKRDCKTLFPIYGTIMKENAEQELKKRILDNQ